MDKLKFVSHNTFNKAIQVKKSKTIAYCHATNVNITQEKNLLWSDIVLGTKLRQVGTI